jgi:hypothetical protein
MKKYSSLIIIGILVLLAGLSIYLYRSKSKLSTVDKDSRNFSYKDTAAITKIFIADKEGNHSTLVRTKTGWVVNDKYACRSEAILNLLEVIKNVEVKMSVPKEARQNVIKYMATRSMKVEIYAGDELVKQYYVGHETDDSEGSFMLLTDVESGKNFDEPYACFIPGFIGFLQPRFIAKENEWRDRIVINYIPPQIKEISVKHFDAPKDSSFSIELVDTKTFHLKNADGVIIPFDEARLKQYLVYYQNISYEVLITNKNKKLQDSLAAQQPFCEISVTTKQFSTDVYKFYRKKFAGDVNPEMGVKYEYDPDRLYLRFANDKEWALGQYFVFGKLMTSRNYFNPQPTTVKK